MANISVRNVLRGTIRASRQNENFQDLAAGVSDGSKDVVVNTAAVGSASVSQVAAQNCTVTGNSVGERTYIQLVNGAGNQLGAGGYYLSWDSEDYAQDFGQHGMAMPRAGSVIGFGLMYGTTSGTPPTQWSLEVVRYDPGIDHDFYTLVHHGNRSFPAPGVTQEAVLVPRNSYSFTTGDVLAVKYSGSTAQVVNFCFGVHLEVQWDS